MTEHKFKTFLEVFEWNGPASATTSVYLVDKREPDVQKVAGYVYAFRYFDAKSKNGKRQNISCTYFVSGKIVEVKDIPNIEIFNADAVHQQLVARNVQKAVVWGDIVTPYEDGDRVIKPIK